MIRNIFFDVMGVIFVVGDDTNELLVPFVQKINKNISREQINKFYLDASLGKITSSEFWLNMGVAPSNIELVEKQYLDENLVIDSDIIEVIKELKENQYNIGFLSNDVSKWGEYLRKRFDLDSLLDFCIISGEAKLRKPDEAIYKFAINKCEIDPNESIFIDDRIKNLIPAKKLGFKTILFDRDGNYKENSDFNKVYCSREITKIVKKLDH